LHLPMYQKELVCANLMCFDLIIVSFKCGSHPSA